MTEQSETLKESLSALMDGEANELEVHRLMQSLESDRQGDLRESWQRYHLTSSAIKGETPTFRIDCSAAIADAVDDEKNHSIIPNNGIFLVLGQTAIAASVALIAILGVQQFNQPAPAIGMQSAALDPYDVNINTGPAMQFPTGFKPRINAQTVAGSLDNSPLKSVAETTLPVLDRQIFPDKKILMHIDEMITRHAENSSIHSIHGTVPLIDVNKADVTTERR